MSVINAVPLLAAAGGDYTISRSVRLRSSASAYFNRTPASAGNRKTWTWSGWVKRGGLPSSGYYSFLGADSGAGSSFYIAFDNSTQQLEFGQGATVYRKTTQVFRDPSAWYHLVIHSDTTQATASNRLKIYVNGVQVTTFATSNDPSLNGDWALNNNVAHSIGADIPSTGARNYFDGYLTEINFIDGQALTPSSFGETDSITGVWKPKKYAGTYGTNGFYLNFSDNSNNTATTIGKDYSGNGNNWTPNNISVTSGVTYDSMLDVPTMWADGGNGRGNYTVLNPLDRGSAYGSLTDGNLKVSVSTTNHAVAFNTMAMPSGKTYLEVTSGTTTSATPLLIAFGLATQSAARTGYGNTNTWSIKCVDARTLWNGGSSSSNFGSAFTSGTTMRLAYDSATGYLWIGDGSNWYNSTGGTTGDPAAGTNPSFTISTTEALFFFMDCYAGSGTVTAYTNFGQSLFAYTPPSGFKALNTQNLPDSTIPAGNKYMDVALQTGNTTGRTVSGLAFQPDLVWVKNRAGSANKRWGLIDSVRGVNKTLTTQATDAEVTSQTDLLTAFNSDGFTIGADAGLYGWNGFAESYVHFVWKAGNGSSSNTNGSITSTVSVNATAGFSVVTYTGNSTANASVGHGLGVSPNLVIIKARTAGSVENWPVYHSSLSAGQFLFLNTTNAVQSADGTFNSSTPVSSTVFQFGSPSNTRTNSSSYAYVAYCFSAVAGYSAFGSYTGNGSATGDGPFVYLGFRPRWLLLKVSSAAGYDWLLYDSSRDTYNVTNLNLRPDLSDAEGSQSANYLDFLSNGFKIRGTSSGSINPSQTIIYAAFAENPFKLSLAR